MYYHVVSFTEILPDDFNQGAPLSLVYDYTWRLPDTCRGYVTWVLPKSCLSSASLTHSRDIRAHSSRCPSIALLSLCIKPLLPITLTPRRFRLSISTSRNLLIFHDFIPAVSTPSSTGSSRSGCLARSFAREYFRQDVSQNLYPA